MIIGLEIELHSSDRYQWVEQIARSEWLHLDRFVLKDWLKVKMSKDYYYKTIEYNFEPKQYSPAYIAKVNNFIQKQIKKYNLKTKCRWPGYVWTHVHIFWTEFRKINLDDVLSTVMEEIDKSFSKLAMVDKKRLVMSHQLWGNYVYNHWWNMYHDDLRDSWHCMMYPWLSENRTKYNPVIISNRSNKGKPRSLEIRIIPNKIILNWEICNILDRISKRDLCKTSTYTFMSGWMDQL